MYGNEKLVYSGKPESNISYVIHITHCSHLSHDKWLCKIPWTFFVWKNYEYKTLGKEGWNFDAIIWDISSLLFQSMKKTKNKLLFSSIDLLNTRLIYFHLPSAIQFT